MERAVVAASCRVATLARLKDRRPQAQPWKDTWKLGRDDGNGYNFRASTVRKLGEEIYAALKADPDLDAIKASFVFPPGFPQEQLIEGDVVGLRQWIVADVCQQAGL